MAPKRGQFVSTVAANEPLCREHFRLCLEVRGFPPTAPGQFVQVAARPDDLEPADPEIEWAEGTVPQLHGAELREPVTVLRRPFSLAGRSDEAGVTRLELIHRVVGVGTAWLSTLRAGDTVHLLGPLGNRFTLPPAGGIGLLVGGGVGIPPMIYLASTMTVGRAVAFCGAVTRDLLSLTLTGDAPPPGEQEFNGKYNVREFSRHGVPAVISTDDGSYGFRGYITQALEQYLDAYLTDNADRNRAVIYTCGPELMMQRVGEIAMRRGIACQIAVERAMACGMGTCQSCVIRVAKPDPSAPPMAGSDWCYRLACTDGPVFSAGDLRW